MRATIFSSEELAGLPIEDALDLVRQRIDAWHASEMERVAERMRADGLDRSTIEGMIEDQRLDFADNYRSEYLDRVHSWLLRRDRRLN